ncbi:MAG TPA: hypothetical protein VIY28_07450 [Pseudonocardiaceae bacterium]
MSVTDTNRDKRGNEPARDEAPSVAVRRLDRLFGTWQLSGDASGTVTYHPFLGQRSEHVHNRFYGSEGDTLDYVYELDGDTLTIWGGEKGSPSYFQGTFDAADRCVGGSWVWPGGDYDATMTRIG